MIGSIVGYHLNPWTCGIAKFNAILARMLDVPVVGILDAGGTAAAAPLLSIKLSEFAPEHLPLLERWIVERAGEYDLFLHAVSGGEQERRLIASARRVFCGNRELASELTPIRSDNIEVYCPGTIQAPRRIHQTALQIFTFGMAHKIRVDYYRKLERLIAATGASYKVFVSTALHEGTSFDDSFVIRFEELQEIFGPNVYFMGYLSDTAVFNHLMDASFLAAFFERGLRANNTTVNAAFEFGKAVVTNLDEYSPRGYEHLKTVLDINRLDVLPDVQALDRIGQAAADVARRAYAWDGLVAQIRSEIFEEKGI
jgi:hypothetical protein